MRNFSKVSVSSNFVTYNVCDDESDNPILIIGHVLAALSGAFETSSSQVHRCWADIISFQTLSEEFPVIPSEYRVLEDLFHFYLSACARWSNEADIAETEVFVYVNLNTGSTVTWASLC